MLRDLVNLLIAVGLAAPLLSAQARRSPPPAPKLQTATGVKALVELEKRILTAIRAHDANTLDGILAADFVYVSPRKPDLRKPEFLKEVGSSAQEIEWLGAEEMKIHIYGDMAVVTGIQHAKVRLPKGGIQSGDSAFTDVFRKSNGEWWLVLAFGVDIPTAPEGK